MSRVWPSWAIGTPERPADICPVCGWHILLCECATPPEHPDWTAYRAAEGIYDAEDGDE